MSSIHQHIWGPYDDVPFGENPRRYRKCKECGAIAYLKIASYMNDLNDNAKNYHKIKAFLCSVPHCGGEAIYRIRGRRDTRGAAMWACKDHIDCYEECLPKIKA
jgi:hypothetical protein